MQRRQQAVVVEHGRPELARQREQLLHRLAGQALGLVQLAPQRPRRVLDRGLEPQRDRGQRLVDLVVKVLGDPPALALLGLDRGPARLAAGGLEPRQHPVDRGVQALGLGAVDPVVGTSWLFGVARSICSIAEIS